MNHALAFPTEAGTHFTDPEEEKAESTQLADYIPRWFTHPKTVSNPSKY